MHEDRTHQKRAREFHARAIEAISCGEMRSARTALQRAGKEFRAANDKSNAALVDALVAFAEADRARATLAIGDAHVAASRAWAAAHRAGRASLAKDVERFEALLDAPVATNAGEQLDSAAIAELLRSPHHIVVDVRSGNVFSARRQVVDLAMRPLVVDFLSSLARTNSISSRALAKEIFRVRSMSKKHEARLRSILTVVRKLTKGRLGDFDFAGGSFSWTPKRPVIVLVPLAPLLEARLEFLFERGSPHATRSLAKHFDQSLSATKQALNALEARGSIRAVDGEKWVARSALDGIGRVQLF